MSDESKRKKDPVISEEARVLEETPSVNAIDGVDEISPKNGAAKAVKSETVKEPSSGPKQDVDKPRKESSGQTPDVSKPVGTPEIYKKVENVKKEEEKAKAESEGKKARGLKKQFVIGQPSPLEVAVSIRYLSLMLKSGLSLMEALKTIQKQSASPKLKQIYTDVVEQVEFGKNLADSMKKYKKIFSTILISVVDVGEQAGTLEKNLIFIADYLKKQHEIRRKVRGALMYPLIIFMLTFAEMAGVIFFVFPKLENLFQAFDNIPAFTVAIMTGSQFVRANILWFILGLLVLGTLFWLFSKTRIAKVMGDNISLRFPIVKNLIKSQLLASFSRTLGILLESGIPISKAIKIASESIDNVVYAKILAETHENVKEGRNLNSSLEKYPKYFPNTYVEMIEISEESGTLEENLFYLYEFYEEEIEDMVTNLTTILEPILIVFLGASIAILALMIIGPIYQLVGSINE